MTANLADEPCVPLRPLSGTCDVVVTSAKGEYGITSVDLRNRLLEARSEMERTQWSGEIASSPRPAPRTQTTATSLYC